LPSSAPGFDFTLALTRYGVTGKGTWPYA